MLFGAATPMDAPMAPSLFGYTRTGPYGYDPNRARQLLLEGGTPGLALRFIHPTGRSIQEVQAAQVAQAIAGNLHDVGVDVDLIGSDWPSYLAAISVPEDRRGAHAPVRLGARVPGRLAADDAVRARTVAAAGPGTSHYSNPRVEELLDPAPASATSSGAGAYAEAQRIVWDDAPWIFLWVPSFPIVHTAQLTGIAACRRRSWRRSTRRRLGLRRSNGAG